MGIYNQVKAHPQARISPAATVIGDVTLGACSSVFASASLRGDDAPITVGDNSNIQEGCCVHVDAGCPCSIGSNVTVGHGAIVHGCAIEDGALVGMGAIIMNGAVIGAGSMVAAGALVTQGKVFPPKSLIMGSPAKLVRELSDEESRDLCLKGSLEYLEVSAAMLEEGLMRNPGARFRMQQPGI